MSPEPRWPLERLQAWAVELLCAAGASADAAADTAQALVWCDACGRPDQGLARLPLFARRILGGGIDGQAEPESKALGASLLHVNGRDGCGHHVAAWSMRQTIGHAREQGLAVTLVHNSNHYGAGGYYCWLAAEAGFVAIVLSNAYPKVAPPGGSQAVLGTNPFSFGAPRSNGRHLLVDFSTAAIAGSTFSRLRATGQELPPDTVIESSADDAPVFLPAAGGKGFGLALAVEVLTGAIAAGRVTAQLGSVYGDPAQVGGLGHFMMVLDPGVAVGRELVAVALDGLLGPLDSDAMRYPGLQRMTLLAEAREQGVTLDLRTRNALTDLARELGVDSALDSTLA